MAAGPGSVVTSLYANLLLDLLLPRTDAAVRTQWIVMTVLWSVVLFSMRHLPKAKAWGKDVLLLVVGLAMMNLAWFAVRAIH